MGFTRWDPLRDLLALQAQLDQFAGATASGWLPPIDLYETADSYVLLAEVPGLTRDQLDIRVQGDQLTLSGERPVRAVACERFHRVERGHGSFSRTFSLGTAVDAAAVTADLQNGVLTVTLPKAARRGPRRIDVQ
ncbi:MAG TPA: Hsp20/alpha crystallin family protein [Vicinamibacterales bacterium]|nr:Hsp20/alpha crystallin family protein [Vicinamibacterales bacterium]